MIQKGMRAPMAVTLAILFVMLAFGRGRLARFYDDVGTAAAEFAANVRAPIARVFVGDPLGDGETQDRLRHEIPRVAASSTTGGAAVEAASPDNATAEESAPPAVVRPERETPAEEAPPALPDPQAVRDSAAAEVEALGPLHDELIEVLEAIQEAQTDRLEKRWAADQVTLARLAKRHDLRNLQLTLAGEAAWQVRGARRSAAIVRARLDHKIAEARQKLAELRRR